MHRYRASLAVVCVLLTTAGCVRENGTAARRAQVPSRSPSPTPPVAQLQTTVPVADTTVLAGRTATELALATSRVLYARSPAVVLVGDGDPASLGRAAKTAVTLGVPLLLTPVTASPSPAPSRTASSPGATAQPTPTTVSPATSALRNEVARLGASTLVTAGEAAAAWARAESTVPGDTAAVASLESGRLPTVVPAAPLTDVLVIALDQPVSAAAVATARASGARVVLTANPDPRTSNAVITALAGHPIDHIVAIGAGFGPAARLRNRVETAGTGVLLPGGGQVVFPGRRLVALYGHPGNSQLGSLGEQSLSATLNRARQVAAAYRPLVKEPVVPTLEIIATIASRGAGTDGNYSTESPLSKLRPWVDAAREAGIYVILDLQPGRTDFLTQAKLYTSLLMQPNVGLALDPEWRLGPDQVHLAQIGSVTADEINRTATWLADLTRDHKLPQKVLMVHQFRLDMITGRPSLRTDFDELSIVLHADGFGSAGQKFNTWRTLHLGAPARAFWGWKNFYDEDTPTFTPSQTVAVAPSPVVITYQ